MAAPPRNNPSPVGSPPLLRRLNSAHVFSTIRERGPIVRADIARHTGISKPTVTEVVEALIAMGYVTEQADPRGASEVRPSRPGPRGKLLTFRANLGYVIGVDVGADQLKALVADLDGGVLARCHRDDVAGLGANDRVEAIRALIGDVLAVADIPSGDVQGVAIGTPGLVDSSGQVTLAPQLPGWDYIDLRGRLQADFDCPVSVENEVRLSLLAERWKGTAQGVDNVYFVQLGVGIGGAMTIGGRLHRGANGFAGEIGYLPVDDATSVDLDAPGPFEREAGARAFARLGREAATKPEGATLLALAGGDPAAIDARLVFAAVAADDPAAIAIVDKLANRLALGIAAICCVVAPELIVLGGGVARAREALQVPLTARVQALVPHPPRILGSSLLDESVALGAVRLALDEVDQRLFSFGSTDNID